MGSTSIPFHSSSRWAIGMLPGDASQEGRRNEIQFRTLRSPRAAGGEEAPERDPARDPPPPARQDGSAPPSPELREGPLRSAPAPRPKLRPRLRCGAAIATAPPGLRLGPAVPSPRPPRSAGFP
ncbi:basic proline-rich protein-like [Numida meleagris]|uniref:basic proline-rich protein-like n=1 Tax=Numida meleagris TaxID=8996 RepID=UPI000B3D826A|nr:basic proline-rich protein-like [Numida meleagris]